MAYAIDIVETTFKKTKEAFFPIKPKYWLKMGIVSLFIGGNGGSGSSGNGNSFNSPSTGFREAIAKFNTEALSFLSTNVWVISIILSIITVLSLVMTYIGSVFTFVFIEGILKKEISIRKGFSQHKKEGLSFFYFRFILGMISFAVLGIILSPIIYAFFTNNLVGFNLWLLIPIFFVLFLFILIQGLFVFLVNEFVVPIMYFKKIDFTKAWKYFREISRKNKKEIFLYFLFKILLGMASGILALLVLVVLLIVLVPFVLLGILLYGLISQFSGIVAAIVVVTIFGFIVLCVWVTLLSAVLVPITAFFRMYSIEMLKKLEEKKI